jgi:RNA polymerase sigma-70 factor (ECF subfamily)
LPAALPEPAHEFWAAVRSLSPAQAQVVALHYVEDRSIDDIATVLGIAPGTVKTHLSRARHALAEKLRLEKGDA